MLYAGGGSCVSGAQGSDKGLFPAPAPPAGYGDEPQPENLLWPHGLAARTGAVDEFARDSYPSYYVEQTKTRNCQLREMLKAVLDELLKHGADIHDFKPPNEEGLSHVSVILRNLEEGRELEPTLRAY